MTPQATISTARPANRLLRSCWARSIRPPRPFLSIPMFYEAYMSPWINDEFKATSRLTVTPGLRFDYQFARTESRDQYSTFDPNTPNPGAGGIPGAIIFAGKGAGRAGIRTFEKPNHDAWGPRLGFAYRLGDKTAIRGGYGIYYSGISFDQFIGQPTHRLPVEPNRHQHNQWPEPGVLAGQWIPANDRLAAVLHQASAVHRSHIRQRHCSLSRWPRMG